MLDDFKGHIHYMRQALQQAQFAFEADEVPVGAVVACGDHILAKTHNQVEQLTDVTAHAEILAITAASHYLGSKYLNDCTIYVSLEPCPMCAAALQWAQVGRIVFGASDKKRGFRTISSPILHPKTEVISGVLGEEAAILMRRFFQQKR